MESFTNKHLSGEKGRVFLERNQEKYPKRPSIYNFVVGTQKYYAGSAINSFKFKFK
jgi:hypothetical protein